MPWSPKQMKAIRAKKHGWDPPGDEPFSGVSRKKLTEMEDEGVRHEAREARGGGRRRKRSGMKGHEAAEALAGYRRKR